MEIIHDPKAGDRIDADGPEPGGRERPLGF